MITDYTYPTRTVEALKVELKEAYRIIAQQSKQIDYLEKKAIKTRNIVEDRLLRLLEQ